MSLDPRTPMAQQHDAHRARQRRDRALAISLSVLVVVGLVGFGSYLLLEKSEASDQERAAAPAEDAKAPSGSRSSPPTGRSRGCGRGTRRS